MHRPVRVVVDSRLRTPPEARVVRGAKVSPTWILCARDAPAARSRRLAEAGVRVLPVRRRGRHLDLARICATLAREGLTTILCEGGGQLAAGLIRAGLDYAKGLTAVDRAKGTLLEARGLSIAEDD